MFFFVCLIFDFVFKKNLKIRLTVFIYRFVFQHSYVSMYLIVRSCAGGGGHLYLELDIILVKKFHVIRVFFRTMQAMYARTSFRGAKTCKIGKKGCVLVILTNFWKEHGVQIKKNACKNAYLGSIFIPENTCLGCVLKVLLRG